MRKNVTRFVPLCIMLTMLTWGCAPTSTTSTGSAQKPGVGQKQDANTYTGKVLGKSNKARTVSIEVGKEGETKTMMLKFDDKTTGLEHAVNGEAAIIAWEMRGGDKYATVIKPKLAKLPEGVAEIKADEVKSLVDSKGDYLLIDSRPENRFAQSHLPGAISITVEQMKAGAADLLPKEKDKLLVFYCGGYT
ncbi:MAG: rhodanese-like domain-containing protein [Desulfobulbaceae bacterium]